MRGIESLIVAFGGLITTLLSIVVALAILLFFWGLATFVFKSGDPKSHVEGRSKMIWGIMVLFIMTCLWGIIAFIRSDLGLNSTLHQAPCGQTDDDPCY